MLGSHNSLFHSKEGIIHTRSSPTGNHVHLFPHTPLATASHTHITQVYTHTCINALPQITHRPLIFLSISVPLPPLPRQRRPCANYLYLFAPLHSAHAPLVRRATPTSLASHMSSRWRPHLSSMPGRAKLADLNSASRSSASVCSSEVRSAISSANRPSPALPPGPPGAITSTSSNTRSDGA